ncbi:MAG: glycerol-3-phosphate acyltransferase [Acidimicrobiales bacterium]|nr:glycerol-3-phosphate acyltransferase [Acidimicrobiales bacterium]
MILGVILVVVAYVVGMFPTAQLAGRRLGVDPTEAGSGNPGASNIYRLGGRKAGLIVFAVDALKGAIPAGVALIVAGRPEAHAVWIAAVAGHVWPITRGLRGGKGVATAGGAGLVISPLVGLACLGVFLITVKLLRFASLGSLGIAISYPIIAAVAGFPGWEIAASSAVAAILVIRHQSNIRRVLKGAELSVSSTDDTAA